jgi:hypothetical protein
MIKTKEEKVLQIVRSSKVGNISCEEAAIQICLLLNDLSKSEKLCENLDNNFNCRYMCLSHCVEGKKFWK